MNTNLVISVKDDEELQELKNAFRVTWALAEYKEFENARSYAIANGWRATPQRVQVRHDNGVYYIEPYEGDCSCPNIIKPF